MTSTPPPGRHVVVGMTPEASRTCAALQDLGLSVTHLGEPSETELARAMAGGVSSLAVLLHNDTQALRYCLAAEHLRPGLPMVVAIFDKTAATQLVRVVPNCRVTSPADLATPSLVAACLPGDLAGLVREPSGWRAYPRAAAAPRPFALPPAMRFRAGLGKLLGQLRPHDSGSQILMTGLSGLLLLLLADTVAGVSLLHKPFVDAFHTAVQIVATVGPASSTGTQPAYVLFAALAMLVTIGLTAMFTAGIVEHLLSGRLIGLWGRRVLPRRGHVVVVGMGQVGLRLASELKALGLGVVGIERDRGAPNLMAARASGIPVLIGDGSRRAVLSKARVDRAVAFCAVGSDELDNIAAAVTARAVAPEIRVALRAGNHDAIAETRSLFHIGTVCDVTGLTAAYVVQCLVGRSPRTVVSDAGQLWVWDRLDGPIRMHSTSTECAH